MKENHDFPLYIQTCTHSYRYIIIYFCLCLHILAIINKSIKNIWLMWGLRVHWRKIIMILSKQLLCINRRNHIERWGFVVTLKAFLILWLYDFICCKLWIILERKSNLEIIRNIKIQRYFKILNERILNLFLAFKNTTKIILNFKKPKI